jgi:hypothetical protein
LTTTTTAGSITTCTRGRLLAKGNQSHCHDPERAGAKDKNTAK